ncbi:MAG: AraC family transcriptional regulator [Clostridiaceae bacterium]|nr:AraC family transcriptional regulator [Clostridiaceae bacterium]
MHILSANDFFHEGEPPVSVRTVANHGVNSMHGHEFYEMVFILQGFTLHSCGGASSILTAGDIFCMPPGTSHAYIATHQTWLYNILFLPSALEACGVGSDMSLYRVPMRAKANPVQRQEMIPILERLLAEPQTKGAGWDRMVMAKFGELLVLYERIHETTPHLDTSNAHYRQLMRALQYIEGSLNRDILLEEVAATAGLSTGSLTRQFKLVTGLAPMEYARSQRMAKAAELLKDPAQSVSDVARDLGFSDISVFSRQFKQITGMSPSEFRKNV